MYIYIYIIHTCKSYITISMAIQDPQRFCQQPTTTEPWTLEAIFQTDRWIKMAKCCQKE